MKIAFTSCFDASQDPTQEVWLDMLGHQPDVLLLLGDSIYMDFWPHLGRPRTLSDAQFAEEMYSRYRRQWGVASFRTLIRAVAHVGIIWDDHDFAWNGACGTSRKEKCDWNDELLIWQCTPTVDEQPYIDVVSDTKKRIAHALFSQFKQVLRTTGHADTYPDMPLLADMLAMPAHSITEVFNIGEVRIILLDTRSFREPMIDPYSPGLLLGAAQQQWLLAQSQHSGISLICSGTALTRGSESWDKYRDYQWLMEQPLGKAVVLSGDIHKNAQKLHKYGSNRLLEITSSGAAQPGLGGDCGNFGLIETDGQHFQAWLCSEGHPPQSVNCA